MYIDFINQVDLTKQKLQFSSFLLPKYENIVSSQLVSTEYAKVSAPRLVHEKSAFAACVM